MADPNADPKNVIPPAGGESNPDLLDDPDPTPKKTYTHEEHKALVERAVRARFKNFVPKADYEQATTRAAELEDASMGLQSENQKLKATLAERDKIELRAKIGTEMGLPESLRKYIQGADEAAMKAAAETLRKDLGIRQDKGQPVPKGQTPSPENENEFMNGFLMDMVHGDRSR
jgi:hypothetical protein